MSKIERSKIINYEFKSEMSDIGVYRKRLKLLRKRPSLQSAFTANKTALCGGIPPVTKFEMLMIDAMATVNVFCIPVDDQGNEYPVDHKERSGWMDDILDDEILLDLREKWIEYQNSFYPEPKKQEAESEETKGSNTAADSSSTVQG